MKVCTDCKTTKPFSQFSKNKLMKDGYQNSCKACQKAREDAKGTISKDEAIVFYKAVIESGKEFTCKCCGDTSTAENFYYQRAHGKIKINTSKCRDCQKEYQRRKAFPTASYEDLLKKQHGMCAICGVQEKDYIAKHGKKFAIDHNHKTGQIRGLLCCKCNRGLGYFQDSITNLENAIAYLS